MEIRAAKLQDLEILANHDKHIAKPELETSIRLGRVYIAEEQNEFIGWLRYNLFWDSVPFLNMLYLLEDYRGKGLGRRLAEYWEARMRESGYDTVLTSTQSNEFAQHFYQKLGYAVIGGFLPENDPYELILSKKL